MATVVKHPYLTLRENKICVINRKNTLTVAQCEETKEKLIVAEQGRQVLGRKYPAPLGDATQKRQRRSLLHTSVKRFRRPLSPLMNSLLNLCKFMGMIIIKTQRTKVQSL